MGKRELLIVALFGAVGIVAYQLLVPASVDGGESAPSLSRWLARARSGGRGTAVASVVRDGRFAVSPTVSVLRIAEASAVVVRGEDRDDIAYQLTVEANGRDAESARAVAERVALVGDQAGATLALAVDGPPEARLAGALTVQVPRRLAVLIGGARHTDVSGVESVTLDRVLGEAHLREIAGAVSGSHRNGDLSISGAATVALNLIETTAVLTGIRDRLRLTARNGESRVGDSSAAVEIESTGNHVRLEAPAGPIRIFGSGGDVEITRPRETVHVDVRSAPVTIVLDRPVPVAIFARDRVVRVAIEPGVIVGLDARTTEGGSIDATALGLTPATTTDGARVQSLAPDAATIAIRNQRGAIEIVQTK